MKIKKRISTESLRRKVDRQQIELESALLSANYNALDLVNPNEAYFDTTTGETWLPMGFGGDVDILAMPFRNESELRMIRQRGRITALKNPYAKNLLNSIAAFTVGKGHKYSACLKKGFEDRFDKTAGKKLCAIVQRFLDKLLKMNKWARRQRQIIWRYHRDGEVFIRLFYQDDGMTAFRFVEPAQVFQPTDAIDDNASFGVLTEEDDAENVTAYYVDEDKVPAEEIQHRKANVDLNMKRGLSTLFTIREHLDRALKLLRNMSITVANQTAMTMIRHHKATGKQVQSFAAKAAKASTFNPRTGLEQKQSSIPPGAVMDVVDGKTRYEFPANGLNAASPVQVLAAELRAIAASMSWPEFMIGSDAANANYSSTMVAENPAVKSIETEQNDHIADDLELLWAAVEHAVNVGRLPADVMTAIEIEVEPPIIITRDPYALAQTDEILNRLRVKSVQTIQSGHGLDSSQEAMNFSEQDDADLDGNPLAGPLTGAGIPSGDVQATALNGAQVTALVTIVERAALGGIPKEAVPAIIQAAFPNLDSNTIEKIVGPLKNFKPSASAIAA